jgi:hypothetical protein
MKYDQEVYEALAENERTALTDEVLRIGEVLGLKTTSSDYNAFKVMEVIKQLIDASLLASKPPKKKQLGYNEIMALWWGLKPEPKTAEHCFEFARAIEAAHGIGE